MCTLDMYIDPHPVSQFPSFPSPFDRCSSSVAEREISIVQTIFIALHFTLRLRCVSTFAPFDLPLLRFTFAPALALTWDL
jgi:hypothetical protein